MRKDTGFKDMHGTPIYVGDRVSFLTHPTWRPKEVIEYEPNKYLLKDTYIILCDMEVRYFQLVVDNK